MRPHYYPGCGIFNTTGRPANSDFTKLCTKIRNSPLPRSGKSVHNSAQPAPPKGRCASSRNVGAGCGGRCGVRRVSRQTKTRQRTVKSCGPGAATLALPAGACSRITGARKAASPGRSRISRQTIARGKPGCLGCTCQIRVRSLLPIAHGAFGCIQHPAFPAPSPSEGDAKWQNPGRIAPRERLSTSRIWPPPRCYNSVTAQT